ncbi:MAG: HRDC domain-containing protein, partial [Bacteroidales bacterium]
GANSAWTFCISYEDTNASKKTNVVGKSKIDYRDLLSPEDFSVFVQLRTLRKTLAEKAGIPPFAIFSNEQLAEMVRRRVVSTKGLRDIDGIGDARIERYAEAFLALLRKTSGDEA